MSEQLPPFAAVVIHEVAGLGASRQGRAELWYAADAVSHGAHAQAVAAGGTALVLVQKPVAVVVDTVADFRAGRPRGTGVDGAVDAVWRGVLKVGKARIGTFSCDGSP